MCEENRQDYQEIMSIEEYLYKRQKLKEESGKRQQKKEKSSAFFLQNFLCGD